MYFNRFLDRGQEKAVFNLTYLNYKAKPVLLDSKLPDIAEVKQYSWFYVNTMTWSHAIQAYAEVKVHVHTFLTKVWDGGEWWLDSPYGLFARVEKDPSTHWALGWVGPKASLDALEKRKNSCLCRELNDGYLVIQPGVCTDWAFPMPRSRTALEIQLYVVLVFKCILVLIWMCYLEIFLVSGQCDSQSSGFVFCYLKVLGQKHHKLFNLDIL